MLNLKENQNTKMEKTITIKLTAKNVEMLEELIQDTGATNMTDIIRQSIVVMHRQFHKDYIRMKDAIASPKDIERKNRVKEDATVIRQKHLCEQLEGKVEGNSCVYYNYELVNPTLVEKFETTIPLSRLNNQLIANQYSPSREDCEKVLRTLKHD